MQKNKKFLYVTGTRAEFGKMKSILNRIEKEEECKLYIYVTGMHMDDEFGCTYNEIINCGYQNIYLGSKTHACNDMSLNIGRMICDISKIVKDIEPDFIIVYGDRIEALAGAIVGALQNIRIIHFEGGEISGTIDESIRHAITKMSHIHFVSNQSAQGRVEQMGENPRNVYVVGSPDVESMLSKALPSIEGVKEKYNINYDTYFILIYHPVTTEYNIIEQNIEQVISAILLINENFIIIYPNNDLGSQIIIKKFQNLKHNTRIKLFKSIEFEDFLTLLKNSTGIIGNSSVGIREACVYGIPAIDIGSRQDGRYSLSNMLNIQHVEENKDQILEAVKKINNYRKVSYEFGDGKTSQKVIDIINNDLLLDVELQKKFNDKTNRKM